MQLVVRAIESGDSTVLSDARRIGQYKEGETIEVQDLANRLFHTVYMGTENSSSDTRSRCAQCPEGVVGETGIRPAAHPASGDELPQAFTNCAHSSMSPGFGISCCLLYQDDTNVGTPSTHE